MVDTNTVESVIVGPSVTKVDLRKVAVALDAAQSVAVDSDVGVFLDLSEVSGVGVDTSRLVELARLIALTPPLVHLRVVLPDNLASRAALYRAGVTAALRMHGSRSAVSRLGLGQGEFPFEIDDGRWSHVRENPHRLELEDIRVLVRRDVETLADRFFRKHTVTRSDKDRAELATKLSSIAVELAENTRHAFHSGPHLSVPPGQRRSWLSVFVTKGGGEESYNRLTVIVSDTGMGMESSLRQKCISPGPEERRGLLFSKHVRGELDCVRFAGGTGGLGYQRVVALIREFGGTLRVKTSVPGGQPAEIVLVCPHEYRRTTAAAVFGEPTRSIDHRFFGLTVYATVALPTAYWGSAVGRDTDQSVVSFT